MSFFIHKIKYWLPPTLIAIVIVFGFTALRGQLPDKPIETELVLNTEEPIITPRKGFAKPQKVEDEADEVLARSVLATCQSLADDQMRLKCEDALHYSAIIQSGSEDDCRLINSSTLKQLCYDKVNFSLAVEAFDLLKCELIDDANLKNNCLSQIQSLIAKNSKTKEACDLIESETLKAQCLSRFYTAEASKTLNQSSCNKISNQGLKEECREIVVNNKLIADQSQQASLNIKNISSSSELLSLCEKLGVEREVDCKNAIYPRLALEYKDINECSKISIPSLAEDCFETQGQAINEHYLRNSIAQNNKTLCDQITNGDIKNLCLSS